MIIISHSEPVLRRQPPGKSGATGNPPFTKITWAGRTRRRWISSCAARALSRSRILDPADAGDAQDVEAIYATVFLAHVHDDRAEESMIHNGDTEGTEKNLNRFLCVLRVSVQVDPRLHSLRMWNPPSTLITSPVLKGSRSVAIATTAARRRRVVPSVGSA